MSTESDGRFDDFSESLRLIRNDIERRIKEAIEDNTYSREIDDIAIIPIIIKFDPTMEKEGCFKERRLIKRKSKVADMRLRIDYDKFVQGDEERRKLLIIGNIIQSIKEISRKVKDFKGKELEKDILAIFNLSEEDLSKI